MRSAVRRVTKSLEWRWGAALVVLTMTANAPAQAATISITDIEGGWTAVDSVNTPNPTLAINNNIMLGPNIGDSVRWGGDPTSVMSGSGFAFFEGVDIADVPLDTPFTLGVFAHANFQTPPESRIESADYELSFATSGLPNLVTVGLRFVLTETLNDGSCEFGGVALLCNDRVTAQTPDFNVPIVASGTTYYLNIVGFSPDGGSTTQSVYDTTEETFNLTTLYGLLTEAPLAAPPLPTVPEPATTLLLLTGVGVVARRLAARARG